MRKLFFAAALLVSSMAWAGDVYHIHKVKGGLFGYKYVSEDHDNYGGDRHHSLSCHEPGFSRCRFTTGINSGGFNHIDQIMETLQGFENSNLVNGSYHFEAAENKIYSVIWHIKYLDNNKVEWHIEINEIDK